MALDKFDILGPIFAAIGEVSAAIVGDNPDGLYLYAEAKEGCFGDGIFMDEGESIRYYEPTAELCDLLHEAREAEGKDTWVVMEYEIAGEAFDAKLTYPDEIDSDVPTSERQNIFLRRHFGDKPIIYPTVSGDTKRL